MHNVSINLLCQMLCSLATDDVGLNSLFYVVQKGLILAFIPGHLMVRTSMCSSRRSLLHVTRLLCDNTDFLRFFIPPDPTLTVDDVTKVINKMEGDKVEFDIPRSLSEEIGRKYSTDGEKGHAYADYYVHIHPDASWKHLATKLWYKEELTAAREAKSFMTTGKCECHVHVATIHFLSFT